MSPRGLGYSTIGLKRRLGRIFRDGKAFIAALDHGVGLGFAQGLEDPLHVLTILSDYVDAVIINKGVLQYLDDKLILKLGIILKLNGITQYSPNPYDLRLIASVEDALSYDADAVSYEIYIGGPQEFRQLEEAALIIREARRWDLPIILHVYPHGESREAGKVSHCIRLGWEMGATVVKTYYYPGIGKHIAKVRVPVVVAGGPRMDRPEDVLQYVQQAMDEGVSGVALGRNLWGWDEETTRWLASRIRDIVKRR